MPCIMGMAIIGVIFSNMFDVFGIINAWLTKLDPAYAENVIAWFSNRWSAMLVLVFVSVWCTFGQNALYFTAALSNVPEDLYEAAKIDGATRWQMFYKITIPMIVPVFQIILLLSINGTLHTNEYILTMTNGGPAGSTHTVMSYIVSNYVPGFSESTINIGYGWAVSFFTSICMAFIAVIYTKLSNRAKNLY